MVNNTCQMAVPSKLLVTFEQTTSCIFMFTDQGQIHGMVKGGSFVRAKPSHKTVGGASSVSWVLWNPQDQLYLQGPNSLINVGGPSDLCFNAGLDSGIRAKRHDTLLFLSMCSRIKFTVEDSCTHGTW